MNKVKRWFLSKLGKLEEYENGYTLKTIFGTFNTCYPKCEDEFEIVRDKLINGSFEEVYDSYSSKKHLGKKK